LIEQVGVDQTSRGMSPGVDRMKVIRSVGERSGVRGDWVNSEGDRVDSEVRPHQ
jgi:hypothetical protein